MVEFDIGSLQSRYFQCSRSTDPCKQSTRNFLGDEADAWHRCFYPPNTSHKIQISNKKKELKSTWFQAKWRKKNPIDPCLANDLTPETKEKEKKFTSLKLDDTEIQISRFYSQEVEYSKLIEKLSDTQRANGYYTVKNVTREERKENRRKEEKKLK